jgi:hypothetical protein
VLEQLLAQRLRDDLDALGVALHERRGEVLRLLEVDMRRRRRLYRGRRRLD